MRKNDVKILSVYVWPVTPQVFLIVTTQQSEYYYSRVINKDLKVK